MGTTACKECISDLEGQDQDYNQNILEGIEGNKGKYQLRYKWVNDELVKVDDHGQDQPLSPLINRKGFGNPRQNDGFDPKFVPEYEIVCDGYNMADKNVDHRNFTLSLSAIKNGNQLDQTQGRPPGFGFEESPDLFQSNIQSNKARVGNGIAVTQPENGAYFQQYSAHNGQSQGLITSSKASFQPSHASRSGFVTQMPLSVSTQGIHQQQAGLARR